MSKKAVIKTGGKQYLVAKDDEIEVELLNSEKKSLTFEPLLIFEGEKVSIGNPVVAGAKVAADIIKADEKGNKIVAIRYKAKKRVHKVKGHRQRHATLKITSITV